jgi:hypothetical protein
MGDQNPVANLNQRSRPEPRVFPDIAPRTDFDFSAMRECQKLAANDAIGSNYDAIGITPYIANSRGSQQSCTGFKTACRASKQALEVVIEIHPVNWTQAMARAQPALSSSRPRLL